MAMDRPAGIEPNWQSMGIRRAKVVDDNRERDRVFDQYARDYAVKYPEAMKLNRRAVRTLASRAATLAIIIGKGDPNDPVTQRSYDHAFEAFESMQRRVAALNRGVVLPEVTTAGEEDRFREILDQLKKEFPVCAETNLRELKILAGARMRVPSESRGPNGGMIRAWHEAYLAFEDQLHKVMLLNKGDAYGRGRNEAFFRAYGGRGSNNEAELREFYQERLGVPYATADAMATQEIADRQAVDRARQAAENPIPPHARPSYRLKMIGDRIVPEPEPMAAGRVFHEEMLHRVDYSAVEKKLLEQQISDTLISRQLAERGATNLQELNRMRQASVAKQVPCPDCAHTATPGKYVGLTVTEDCRRCGGKTTIDSDEKPEQSSTETKPNPPEKVVMFPPAKADAWRELIS
jgi:hypothetical protein